MRELDITAASCRDIEIHRSVYLQLGRQELGVLVNLLFALVALALTTLAAQGSPRRWLIEVVTAPGQPVAVTEVAVLAAGPAGRPELAVTIVNSTTVPIRYLQFIVDHADCPRSPPSRRVHTAARAAPSSARASAGVGCSGRATP